MNIDKHLSTQDCDRYFILNDKYIPNDIWNAILNPGGYTHTMYQRLGHKLQADGISVQNRAFFILRTGGLHTTCWMRTFRRSANVRNKKRIDREKNMLNYFEKFTAPVFYRRGWLNKNVFEKIAEN